MDSGRLLAAGVALVLEVVHIGLYGQFPGLMPTLYSVTLACAQHLFVAVDTMCLAFGIPGEY